MFAVEGRFPVMGKAFRMIRQGMQMFASTLRHCY